MLDREGAKAPQFHAVAAGQRLDDFIEHDVDDPFDVAVIEVLVGSGNLLNKFRFDHWWPPSPSNYQPKSLNYLIFPNPAKPTPGRQVAIARAPRRRQRGGRWPRPLAPR